MLLCEPYLLDPRPDAVYVLWHTDEPGSRQVVLVGEAAPGLSEPDAVAAATGADPYGPGWRRVDATTARLSRTREDADSCVPGRVYAEVTERPVFRHLADVGGLSAGRTPYRVVSIDERGHATVTVAYTLAPAVAGPVRLLLTSDHQLKPMTPANLEKVAETVGVTLDGILFAGDMVNVPDRASEWFDSESGGAFFAGFTGRASVTLSGRTYRGAPLLPHTPLYPAIGNHEVMGHYSATASLGAQFKDPRPGSWNITTYEEMFPHPRNADGGSRWWSRTIGDVHVITLCVAQAWRSAAPTGRGRFQENAADLAEPYRWGHGQLIYEPIARGSAQYEWLARELASPAARRARYRVVMFHHAGHGLGENGAPAFTDPVQTIRRDRRGVVTAVTYAYPLEADYIRRDLEPLLSDAGVHLVHNGHSHLWNRFRNARGVHWLETSNVGNTYGAYDVTSGVARALPKSRNHVVLGDAGGLAPIRPTIAPLVDDAGSPLPYVSSNEITAFSVLDSGDGVVRSYRFDTGDPGSPVVLFDEFGLD